MNWYVFGMMMIISGVMMILVSFYMLSSLSSVLLMMKLDSLNLMMSLKFIMDFYSLSFCGTVMIISGSVFIYSMSYMNSEMYMNRFMIMVSLFIFSMMVLIFSGDVVQLILGWDGLGLSSYLLVCYYNNSNSSNSGGLTLMINRIGDVGMFMMMYFFVLSNHQICFCMGDSIYLSMLLMLVSFTKSAQVPFSAWLPAAMAAPTPVSSLVHSSTLVTAGIYLMIRFHMSTGLMSNWILFFGSMTGLLATSCAVLEVDMKKVIALSTLSHLGIMTSILGFGWESLSFMHLLFHAFFKALLFMVIGYFIHMYEGYQNMKKISIVSSKMPLMSVFSGVSIMSLCGLPYLTGFFSKDLFMESVIQFNHSIICLTMMLMVCLGSFIYSVRIFKSINKVGNISSMFFWEKGNNQYMISMLTLYMLSIMGGMIWSNCMQMSDTVLYIFLEMKMFLMLSMLLFSLLGYKLNSNMGFFMEMWGLSVLSRLFPNNLMMFLSKESIQMDNNNLSPFYSKFNFLYISHKMNSSIKMSFFEMLLSSFLLIFLMMGLLFS